ncbi:hypothetical protein [Psychrobacillus sp.]|uniref:hypothetical protein n=1 Tax=Psychrobacillus sp. TaxID=1871623 RepID=UPI0028BD550F|nr:hypothetical protein [Psychrobacillus sp.]
MEISQENLEKLQTIAKEFSKAFNAMCEALVQFGRWLIDNWRLIKEKVIEFYQIEEKKQKQPKHKGRIDFTRHKIANQVIDRRPRHLIQKIIH